MPLYDQVPYIGPPRSRRPQGTKYGITIHSTQNNASARDEANYAKSRTDFVSSHFYVDDKEIIQSLNTDYGANHAGASWPNDHCIAYEFCGLTSWSTSQWIDRINFDAAAQQMARDCKRWNIPARDMTVAQLRNHERGFNTHNDCRLAFGGTDHTDPGGNFPLSYLINKVKDYLGDNVTPEELLKYDPNDPNKGFVNPDWRHDSDTNKTIAVRTGWLFTLNEAHSGNVNSHANGIKLDAVLAALEGLDSDAVIARVNEIAAAESARIDALEAAAITRDQAIMDLIVSTENGETDAREVVRLIGELLRPQTPTP